MHGPYSIDKHIKLNRSNNSLQHTIYHFSPNMFNNPSLSKSPPPFRSLNSPRSPAFPQFEDPHENDLPEGQQLQPENAPDDEEMPYPEPSSEQTLLPPPNFGPFFALVEDLTSGEHYHPYVHYVFADDDPVIMTAASMRGMGLNDAKYLPHNTLENHGGEHEQSHEEREDHDLHIDSPLPPPIPGIREHYLIVDIGADGRTVIDAQSLSSAWQITNASVRPAPSFDESLPDQGFMLRIEGVEVPSKKKGKGKGKGKGEHGDSILSTARERSQGDIFAALEGLVEGIESSLAIAGKITGFGSRERDEVSQGEAKVDTVERNTVVQDT